VTTIAPIENTRSLIVANVAALALALWFQWPLALLLWPYWVQSLVIGWFSRKRILALQDFSTEGFKINDVTVAPTRAVKASTANFFALHYGFFHLVYFVFLLQGVAALTPIDWLGLAAAAVGFIVNHQASYRHNIEADARGKPNIGTLMFLPYLRIVPMHLTILAGGALAGAQVSVWGLLVFGCLKTAADVAMHVIEHRLLQKGAVSPPKP
jgi:hypothetical protein